MKIDLFFLLPIFKQAIMITVFVLVMMLVIEYITVRTKGKWSDKFSKKPWMQIILSAILGLVPGCLGTYAVVSMYVHRTIGFAAMVTALIATSGDEAFIMFSVIPGVALKIMLSIFVISVVSGLILNIIFKKKKFLGRTLDHKFVHKEEDDCVCYQKESIVSQIAKMIWQRAVILIFSLGFLVLLIFAGNEHNHALSILEFDTEKVHVEHQEHNISKDNHTEDSENNRNSDSWSWERITFLIVTFIGFFIALTVPDHFLKKHLWDHVIKKHFLRLFMWTFGAFLVLYFFNQYVDVKTWIEGNIFLVILAAALVGIIPESGPHIFFISMYVSGTLPDEGLQAFAVLLTSSIVQDGHGAIPLLAESGKSFVIAKLINVVIGLIVGYSLILI
ncbi:MAG: arsenic efflux protein [Bacteroidales bacterium]|nr:arsenic efflux protein [Bacteroidales bacterium]